jgi:hypothetical protein
LIGGLEKDYTVDKLLCRSCLSELVTKATEEADN